jgi:diguanylate cyclase (GGDEF)-like protein
MPLDTEAGTSVQNPVLPKEAQPAQPVENSTPLVPPANPTKVLSLADLGIDFSEEELNNMSPDERLSELSRFVKRDKKSSEQIAAAEKQSRTDALTGLDNRRAFDEEIETEFSRAQRFGHGLSLALLDIDKFKAVNDTYGHTAGDQVLRDVAQIIKDQIRHIDKPARYGGEEMAIIFPETNEPNAINACERIRKAVQDKKFTLPDGRQISVTVTIGLTNGTNPDRTRITSAEGMKESADSALYIGKEFRGEPTRNQVVTATSITPEEMRQREAKKNNRRAEIPSES